MKKFIIFLFFILIITFLYSRYIDNKEVMVNEYLVINENIPEKMNGLKIVQFSDLLYDEKDGIDILTKACNKINEQKPDVVVYTGDLTKLGGKIQNEEEVILILNNIEANVGKYAILGDYDYTNVPELWEKSGFKLLDNFSEYIFKDDPTPIVITGGDNLSNDILPSKNKINYNFVIGLIHKPDDFDKYKDTDINLFLAGHSLGGQVRIPLIGPILKQDGAKTYIDEKYNHDGKLLYVNFGLGYDKYHIRFLDRPSINLYRLYNK